MSRLFSVEELNFIKEFAYGHFVFQIVEAVNEKFSTKYTEKQISSCLKNHHIKTGANSCGHGKRMYRLTTPEQDEIIRAKFQDKGVGSAKDVQVFIRDEFGLNFSLHKTQELLKRRGIRLGTYGNKFHKGCASHNKGKKVCPEIYAIISKSFFQQGHVPHNYVPVGTESVNKEGYHWIKIGDPNIWMLKSRYVWEQETGEKLTSSDKIIYLDGNKDNITIENLAKVSAAEMFSLNNTGGLSPEAEITKCNISIIRLDHAITRRLKNDT